MLFTGAGVALAVSAFDLIYASMCLFLRTFENAQLGILPEAHLTNWEV